MTIFSDTGASFARPGVGPGRTISSLPPSGTRPKLVPAARSGISTASRSSPREPKRQSRRPDSPPSGGVSSATISDCSAATRRTSPGARDAETSTLLAPGFRASTRCPLRSVTPTRRTAALPPAASSTKGPPGPNPTSLMRGRGRGRADRFRSPTARRAPLLDEALTTTPDSATEFAAPGVPPTTWLASQRHPCSHSALGAISSRLAPRPSASRGQTPPRKPRPSR